MQSHPPDKNCPATTAGKSGLRCPLGRAEWIETATAALAERGVDGMRVEVLAKHFGVTKGSFYWHFKDRQDLVEAVLENWKEGRMRDIDKQSGTASGEAEAQTQLRQIIEIYAAQRNRRGIAIELAVRDWARRDAFAAAAVDAVDRYRLESAGRLFVRCGFSAEEARHRSLLLYAYLFGQSLMSGECCEPVAGESRQWIAERIVA